ncbi:hypothetical protein [Paracoccus fontiphilus]|uniref:Uncharacterized protein n=1 Tax=Paracoccus fontiphilus TaxID=1815556 RepID=A0ABV7IKP1_9RHOB|nr:hypothetical protein [Paracoccus fontiphilus]
MDSRPNISTQTLRDFADRLDALCAYTAFGRVKASSVRNLAQDMRERASYADRQHMLDRLEKLERAR